MSASVKKLKEIKAVSSSSVSCPACLSGVSDIDYEYRENQKEFPVYSCPDCRLLFVRPLPISELTERQMDSLGDAELFDSNLLKFLHRSMYINKEIRTIRKLCRDGASLLDVGCGTGWISSCWKEAGFSVVGLEPSEARGAFARETYGLEIVNEYVENISFDKRFDVAILRHVVEHFENPLSVMQKVKESLTDDGVAMVIVPNIDCYGRLLFGVDWEWVLPWHCNFFNPDSLSKMMENGGFEVLDLYQTASPLYYSGSFARKIGSPGLARLLSRFRIPAMLASAPFALAGLMAGLGDNLNIIVRKKS